MNNKKIAIPFLAFLKDVIRPFYWHIAGMVIVMLIWAIKMSLSPYVIKIMLDRLGSSPAQDVFSYLLWPAITFVSLGLLMTCTFRFYDYIALKMKPRLKQNIIEKMVAHMMGHSHEFYQNSFAGALSTKIYDVATGTRDVISITVEQFISMALALAIALYTLSQIDIKFSIVLFVWIIVFIGIVWKYGRRGHKLSDKASEVNSAMIGKIVDILSNIASVRFFAGQPSEKRHINQWTEKEVYPSGMNLR
jgi:ATP-binding cassette, subfamily B, bacterial